MATIKILLGLVCIAFTGQFVQPHRSAVNRNIPAPHAYQAQAAPAILRIAGAEVGVRERTGHNDGKRVAAYLASTGLKKGNPWCAAFVSWVFKQAGYSCPRTAWSPALFPPNRRTAKIEPAMVFGIYFSNLKRIAHCGFVEAKVNHWIITIEGNTDVAGGREGDGVYRKRRHQRSIQYYADWLNEKGGPK